MTGFTLSFPQLPSTLSVLPSQDFDTLIATDGQRVSWMRSHTCPCVYSGGGSNGRLPQLGSAQRTCTKCFGVGVYWDAPTVPMRMYVEFVHFAPTPDEPGVRLNENYGAVQLSEPSITIPYTNPFLPVNDPGQPMVVWTNAGTDDKFIPVDMQARYTAVLQAGIKENLPFQQNLSIAPQGAVTIWDPTTGNVVPVEHYAVSGPTVTIGGYEAGTNYMVEFLAALEYVAWRSAGGLPHVRPLGGGVDPLPRRFRLQALDLWTRQRGVEPQAAGSAQITGAVKPFTTLIGSAEAGP